jgi:molybdate transport system regulatory protein
MDVDFEAYLRAGEVSFEEGDAALLRAIDEHGSLNAAAEALERSYSRAHKRLSTLEGALGPLVERERGGAGGGGSALTENARETLARLARLRAVLGGTAAVEEVALPGRVVTRTGELVTVETDAGTVRALYASTGAPQEDTGERVEVTLTADSVTLQAPGATPGDDETSARNRLQGTVESVDPGTAVARVSLDVGAGSPVAVLVTEKSRQRLGLAPGARVAATFKATAARATPLDVE